MKTYQNGQSAPYGVYVSFAWPDVRFVGADGESIDGVRRGRYRKVPTLLVIAAGPLLGGLFVITFPVLVIAATLAVLGQALADRVRLAADRHAYVAEGRFEPAVAYLNHAQTERPAGDESPTAETESGLADLEKAVDERRAEEKAQDEKERS